MDLDSKSPCDHLTGRRPSLDKEPVTTSSTHLHLNAASEASGNVNSGADTGSGMPSVVEAFEAVVIINANYDNVANTDTSIATRTTADDEPVLTTTIATRRTADDEPAMMVSNGDDVKHDDSVAPENKAKLDSDEQGDDVIVDNDDDEQPSDREVWSSKLQFFVVSVSWTVGLSNIWRFPYLMYKHGGGAFLVPYFIFLILVGMPLVYLEMALGQYSSAGSVSVWKCVPLAKGLGYSVLIISFLVGISYNVLISWSTYYFFASMTSTLPWTTCNNSWNTPSCCAVQYLTDDCSATLSETDNNSTCMMCLSAHNASSNLAQLTSNDSLSLWSSSSGFTTPSTEYFIRQVLDLSDGLSGGLGRVQWRLALCLILTWILVIACLLKGIHLIAKVAYVTVLLPYLILLVLLVQVCLLEGARSGLIFHIHPEWSALGSETIWLDAASQVLFSLGVGYGGFVTLSSYNAFNNNCFRDAIAIPLIDAATSIFASLTLFAALGHVAFKANLPIEQVMGNVSAVRVVYEVFPSGLSDVSVAFSVLFFLLMILVGIGSQFILLLSIITAIRDELPRRLQKRRTELLLLGGLCITMCLFGLLFVTQGSLYVIAVVETYVSTWPVLAVCLLECLAVTWVYGAPKLDFNIWTMTGNRPSYGWNLLWKFITPALVLFVVLYSILTHKAGETPHLDLPQGAVTAGFVLIIVCTVSIVIWPVIALIKAQGSITQRLKAITRPEKGWGQRCGDSDWSSTEQALPEYMVSEKEDLRGLSNPGYTDDHPTFALGEEAGNKGIIPPPNIYDNGDIIDTGSVDWDGDENVERGNWSGRFDFLMSGLGYSVGIGNVWRFPYLVYESGGGAFFIPYLLMLVLVGLPLFYMELAFGQFASVGPITIWKVAPIFKGVGYAGTIAVALVCIYYNVMTSWAVYYFFASMSSELPWEHCNNTWNTPACRTRYNGSEHASGWLSSCANDSTSPISNITNELCNLTHSVNQTTSPSQEYFFNNVLGISSGIDHIGYPRWHLSLCLLLCWLVTFVALIKGVKSAGKIVYVTVLFPYVILLVLFVRYASMNSDAYLEGIKYYVTPQWSRLKDARVWGGAASQLFFSLGLSQGGLVALSSYNRFHYDCYRDAYIVCIVDTLTSVFAGFVIFAILGVMAEEAGTDVENVITSKFTLAYVAYPEAVSRLPLAPMWSLLFYLMLFSLATDSHFLMCEAVVVSLMDEFPKLLAKRRLWVISVLCVCFYLLGLPMVSEGGLYIIILMDSYAAAWAPLVIGLFMCFALSWIYKFENFAANIKAMLGNSPSLYWKIMWKFITPLSLTFILVFSWVMYSSPTYDDYVYPQWAHVIAVLTSIASIIFIPLVAVYQVIVNRGAGGLSESCRKTGSPDSDWGPALDKHRVSAYLPGVINSLDTPQSRTESWVAKASAAAAQLSANVGNIFHTDSSATLDLLIDGPTNPDMSPEENLVADKPKKSNTVKPKGILTDSPVLTGNVRKRRAANDELSSTGRDKTMTKTKHVTFPNNDVSRKEPGSGSEDAKTSEKKTQTVGRRPLTKQQEKSTGANALNGDGSRINTDRVSSTSETGNENIASMVGGLHRGKSPEKKSLVNHEEAQNSNINNSGAHTTEHSPDQRQEVSLSVITTDSSHDSESDMTTAL